MDFYDKLREMLKNVACSVGIGESDLEKYFVPEEKIDIRGLDPSQDADKIKRRMFERMAVTLQNSGNMGSVKFFENENEIREVCWDFDVSDFLGKYADFKVFYKNFDNKMPDMGTDKAKEKWQSNKQKYCKGLFEFAEFINDKTKKNFDELCEYVNDNRKAVNAEIDFPEISKVAQSTHGVGTALACDFLKEIGCTWLCKPDGHIINFFEDKGVDKKLRHLLKEANLEADYNLVCQKPNREPKTYSKEEIIILWFDRFVKELNKNRTEKNQITAYELDRAIWLASTLNFYKDNGSLTTFTKQKMFASL